MAMECCHGAHKCRARKIRVSGRPTLGRSLLDTCAVILLPQMTLQSIEQDRLIPTLQIRDEFLRLSVPGETMGEPVGVSQNSG